jgi:hypothetical protein
VVLVNAFGQLTIPDPATAQLVPVATFIEKNIARFQGEFLNLVL